MITYDIEPGKGRLKLNVMKDHAEITVGYGDTKHDCGTRVLHEPISDLFKIVIRDPESAMVYAEAFREVAIAMLEGEPG